MKAVRLPTQGISYLAGFSDLKEATTSEKPSGAVQRLQAMGRRSENVQRSQASGHRALSRDRGFQVWTLPPYTCPSGNGKRSWGGPRSMCRAGETLQWSWPHVNAHKFLTPKIACDRGHGARKLSFNITAAGGSGLRIRNHYEQFLWPHSGLRRSWTHGSGPVSTGCVSLSTLSPSSVPQFPQP